MNIDPLDLFQLKSIYDRITILETLTRSGLTHEDTNSCLERIQQLRDEGIATLEKIFEKHNIPKEQYDDYQIITATGELKPKTKTNKSTCKVCGRIRLEVVHEKAITKSCSNLQCPEFWNVELEPIGDKQE